ncbi:MAG TPA: CPBP family intramembrane glutamic endopeptidase [Virgibacillus sp.]|nr:CPBP family intramembrane glutamic endopeptidase [Virgibacillus sp.]
MQKQRDIIKNLSDRELKYQLLLSQSILFVLSLILSFLLFDSIMDWGNHFQMEIKGILYYGVGGGMIIVLFDLLIMALFPADWYDDGGINKRIFYKRSINDIILIVIIVSIAEELLFRGVLQTTFGYVPASILFALVHIRYLTKPLLFISVVATSFYIGFLFELTNNLFVTITTHFIVDFLLAIIIRYQR